MAVANSTVYNTLTNACLGPLPDGTIPEAELRRVADALALQLFFYDDLVCLSNDLGVIPSIVDLVGHEYAAHLMRTGALRLVRARVVSGFLEPDQGLVFAVPRGRGAAKFQQHDWSRAAFASEIEEAAAWVVRMGMGGRLDEPQVRSLKEAVIAGATEVPPEQIFGPATEGLAEDVAAANQEAVSAGHRKTDVVSLERRPTGTCLVIAQGDVDQHAVQQHVLDHIGRKADLAIPGLIGLDTQSTALAIACGGLPAAWTGRGNPMTEGSATALRDVMQVLRVPDVGELVRLGRLKPDALVRLREEPAGGRFRKWYAEKVLSDPQGAAAAAADLVASKVGKSVAQRTVDFLTAFTLSAGAGLTAGAIGLAGGAATITTGALAAVIHDALAVRFADRLWKRQHPLKFVERLREVARSGAS